MHESEKWKWKVKVKSLSRVRLFVTPWTAAYQAPPPMGFSRQEYWSGLPLPSPGIGLKKTKSLTEKDLLISMFIPTLFILAKIWKQPSIHWQLNGEKKKYMVYMCNKILLRHRKENKLAIYPNVDSLRGYSASWNIWQRKTNSHAVSCIHVITKYKQLHIENKHVVARGAGVEMGVGSGTWGRAVVHGGK